MTKYKCECCGEKHDKIHIIMECTDCYVRGWKKEWKKLWGNKDLKEKKMDKPETLKNMRKRIVRNYDGTTDIMIYEDDLRALAIKRYKEINKDCGMCHTCDELWLDFFNLTEEDIWEAPVTQNSIINKEELEEGK